LRRKRRKISRHPQPALVIHPQHARENGRIGNSANSGNSHLRRKRRKLSVISCHLLSLEPQNRQNRQLTYRQLWPLRSTQICGENGEKSLPISRHFRSYPPNNAAKSATSATALNVQIEISAKSATAFTTTNIGHFGHWRLYRQRLAGNCGNYPSRANRKIGRIGNSARPVWTGLPVAFMLRPRPTTWPAPMRPLPRALAAAIAHVVRIPKEAGVSRRNMPAKEKEVYAMQVVTVAEMREIEARAERDYALSSPMLMEHAGRSVAEWLRARLGGEMRGRNVLVFVGPGNNGGDGRVMGKYLAQWGATVTYYAWKERRMEVGSRLIPVNDDLAAVREALGRADVVADALLGTGASRPLDPAMRHLIALAHDEKQRRPRLTLLAVDLPTGLNADTGAVDEGVFHADFTVTLAFPKVGLFMFPGANTVGALEVGGIGLPADMPITSGLELLDAPLLRSLLPARPMESNKGTYGKIMALAGSAQYIGAAYFVSAAAARIGAGLVTLATTPEHAVFYAMRLPEITYALLPPESAPPEERADAVLSALAGYTALVIGPGLGQSDATCAMLERVLTGITAIPDTQRPRLIVDADGLNNLAQLERWWQRLPADTVITPHPGEMARLRGGEKVSGGEIDRLAVVRDCAKAWNLVVVLKGAATLIAAPDGRTRVNWPGNAAMATAGTGDVLSGTVGGLLAQGMAPFDAASAAVYLHSRAGLLVSERTGDAGLLAGDLLPQLPVALKQLKHG
jgi:NAD(P)H-hydrate epimerase